jgi:glycosyltransferase involved in cell wall biosynthesis
VRAAARSALAQSGVEVAVVVVDDGSRADPGALDDLDVTVLRNEVSQGVSRARNRGLELASGAWVAFLDDDDLWAPHHLRGLLGAAGDADLVCAGCAVIDLEARLIGIREAPPLDGLIRALHSDNVIPTPSGVLVRADVVRAAGGFDPALSVNADWDLWLRIARDGRVARTDALTVGYTMHPGNMHVDPDLMLRETARIRERHGAAAAALGAPLPGPDFPAYLAAGHRRRGHRLRAAAWYLRSVRTRRRASDLVRASAVLFAPAGARLPRTADRAAAGDRVAWLASVDR